MKKLTAGIFSALLVAVTAGAANAEIASKGYVDTGLGKKQDVSNLTTTIQSAELASDTKYPSEKAVATALDTKVGDLGLGALAKKDTVAAADIDANAVTTEKIMNKNVTKAKLEDTVQTSLGLADTAVQPAAIADMETKTNAEATYAKKTDITDMQVKTNLSDSANAVVTDKDSEDKYPSVKAAHAIAAAAVDGVTGDVSGLETRVETAEGEIDTLQSEMTGKEDVANKVQTAGFDAAAIAPDADTKYPSVKAVYDKLGTKADTSALEGKADKASTLAGYGITDAYTKTETDDKLGLKADKTDITDMQVKTNLSDSANALVTDKESEDKYPSVKAAHAIAENAAAQVSTDLTELEGKVTNLKSTKQDKTDNSLTTKNKTVADAINEVKTTADSAQSDATDALGLATNAIPKPGENCTNADSKCVLVTNGTTFEWEDIAR